MSEELSVTSMFNFRLAIGATFDPDGHPDIPDKPAEFFAFRAKALLEIEMDKPTLSTLQAVLVLSAHEGANGRDSRGRPQRLQYSFST